jgi:hypothetical protein
MALIIGSNPVGYTQNISIAGTCDGTAPVGSVVISYPAPGRKSYAAAAVGGLFLFPENTLNKCMTLVGYEFVLGGQSAWDLYITDGITNLVANDVLIASGTTEASVAAPDIPGIIMLPGQGIRMVTTGTASNAWVLTVKVAYTLSEAGIWL